MFRKSPSVALLVVSSLVVFITSCGSSVHTASPAHGGFTNSSLSGTFSFAISGNNGGGFFAVAGSFQANGNGTITGGTEDFNSPGTGVVVTNAAITGTYTVRTDGRTTASITETTTNPAITVNFDFVLLNASSGLAIRFQNNASASGSIDAQSSSAFNLTSLAGSLAFNISGVDAGGHSESSAGLLNLDASGDILAGSVMDNNDNGTLTTNATISPAGVAVAAPVAGTGRGTIAFTSPVTGATVNFAYYVVDGNHIKIIETDNGAIGTSFLAGDAFKQTSATVSGSFAFTLAGATAAGNGIFAAGGILNTDGAGHIQNTSVTDVYNGGTLFQAVTTSGTYAVSGGRGTATLNGTFGTITLAFYPSTNGLLAIEIDNTVVSSGAALQQTGGPFSNSSLNGSFGLNLTGADLAGGVEMDAISQFSTTGSGTLSGAFDFNDGGALANSLALNGTYTVSANGRGTMILNPSSLGAFNVIFYMASGTKVLFIEPDNTRVSVGTFAFQ